VRIWRRFGGMGIWDFGIWDLGFGICTEKRDEVDGLDSANLPTDRWVPFVAIAL